MSILTFTPPIPPSPGTTDTPELRILSAEFGDGYTQDTPDGLNHIRRKLTLSWELLSPAQCEAILSFLVAHEGCIPFLYTPSDEDFPVQWTCKKWSHTRIKGGMRALEITLTQDFALVA